MSTSAWFSTDRVSSSITVFAFASASLNTLTDSSVYLPRSRSFTLFNKSDSADLSAFSLKFIIVSTSFSHAASTSCCIASPFSITPSASAFAARYSAWPASTYCVRSIMVVSSSAIPRSALSPAFISNAWIAFINFRLALSTSSLVAFSFPMTASPSAIASSKSFCTDSTRPPTSPFATCCFALFRKTSSTFLLPFRPSIAARSSSFF